VRVNVRDSPMTQDGLTAGPHTVGRVASVGRYIELYCKKHFRLRGSRARIGV